MVLPKNTLVVLAGQNAWHICTGEALPRSNGKYLPSQLRTQKAGPLAEATARRGGAACWLRPNGSAKKFACAGAWRCCCFVGPPNRKSNRSSAEATCGASVMEPARTAAATCITRRRRRGNDDSIRNTKSTPQHASARIHISAGW